MFKRSKPNNIVFLSILLKARIEEAKGNSPSQGAIAEGFQTRYFEFQDFERKFEECISKSAVQTKFEKHSSRGKALSSDMRSMLDNIFDRITIFRNLKMDQKTLLNERIQATETEMMNDNISNHHNKQQHRQQQVSSHPQKTSTISHQHLLGGFNAAPTATK